MARFVVIGASGYAGGHLVDELLGRGHEVVAVTRSGIEERERLVSVEGSVDDVALVHDVATGATATVLAVPSIQGETQLSDSLPGILEALAPTGSRLAVIGGAGSLRRRDGTRVVDGPDFPEQARPGSLAHIEALGLLRATTSPVDWLSISPAERFGRMLGGERLGKYRVSEGDSLLVDDHGVSAISGPDFAIGIADELETPRFHRTRITFAY